jgi:hypothetical protein
VQPYGFGSPSAEEDHVSRRLPKAAAVLVGLFAAAQLVRPGSADPATDPTHTIGWELGATSPLVRVLDRSCGDCHSNATAWPWYARLAPLSWVAATATIDGRNAVNFSEWTRYSPDQRRALLASSCQDALAGTMPIAAYARVCPQARLSARDVETICAASAEPGSLAAPEAEPSTSRAP